MKEKEVGQLAWPVHACRAVDMRARLLVYSTTRIVTLLLDPLNKIFDDRYDRVIHVFYIVKYVLGPGKMFKSSRQLILAPSSCFFFNTCYIRIKSGLRDLVELSVFLSYPSNEFADPDCSSGFKVLKCTQITRHATGKIWIPLK